VRGVDVPVASQVLRDPDLLGQVEDDVAVMSPITAEGLGLAAGDRLPVGEDGPRVVLQDLEGGAAFVTAATLAQLAPDAPVTQVWLRLADGVDADDAVLAVEQAVAAVPGATVAGDARERAAFDRVLDTLLLVVTGLLAVAVVIAVVGIANVLSLSELERRRESALLRALGLTRGQLRATMAVEAVLVAAVGALLGVVLGVVYGWAGAATVLGRAVSTVTPAIPAGSLSAVVAAAVAAGLLASYLPGRRAARTSPVVVAGE
jgi:putative ABC transport system permease protein